MTKRDKLVDRQVKKHDNNRKAELKDMKFYELEIIIRAGSIDEINGLIPLATKDFILKQDKQVIGAKAENSFNFCWHLTDENDRKKMND